MDLLYINIDIISILIYLLIRIYIFATIYFEDRNLIFLYIYAINTDNIINIHIEISYDYYCYS